MSRRWWALLAAAAVALAGCTTIPTSSSPQVVRTVDRGGDVESPQPNVTPVAGADPRTIVTDFLAAGLLADAGHSAARQFLTTLAARKWQDNTAVVVDEAQTGNAFNAEHRAFDPVSDKRATIQVTGHLVGQLDSSGTFSPTLKSLGTGDEETFTFTLDKTAGQWRISQLPPGVLLSAAQFSGAYNICKLYFFDSTEKYLVPDLRYTTLRGQSLASWLLQNLLAGPRPELAQSVLDEVPDQIGKPSVTLGDPTVVEIPGITQLDRAGRDGLAAQIAYTLSQFPLEGGAFTLTDSGRPITIPATSSASFSTSDFRPLNPDSTISTAEPYFIRDGAVISGETGKPLAGYLGQSARGLSSIALQHDPSGALLVAGVAGGWLELGTDTKLTRVSLPAGPLSQPEWRPHASPAEVWIGVGSGGAVYRVVAGQRPHPVSITSPVGGLPLGQVLALRFSPDGVRLAAVVRAPSGSAAAWVGSVVTSGNDVRIESFEPVTPALLMVSDVAWDGAVKLLMVAQAPNSEAEIWKTYSDGNGLSSQPNSGLPGPPTEIAAAQSQSPLVAASNSISQLQVEGQPWGPLLGGVTTPGTSPVYSQ